MKSCILILIFLSTLLSCSPKKIKGTGKSLSKGSVKKGSLKNGRRFPKKGDNFKYFSKLTYFSNGRAWVHSKVCDATLDAYKDCKQSMPNRNFMIMECSHKKGGKMFPHRTHQNGTSIDFAVPLLKYVTPGIATSYIIFLKTLPKDLVSIRRRSMPCLANCTRTASARFSPSARL